MFPDATWRANALVMVVLVPAIGAPEIYRVLAVVLVTALLVADSVGALKEE